jgi:hypothetical protein
VESPYLYNAQCDCPAAAAASSWPHAPTTSLTYRTRFTALSSHVFRRDLTFPSPSLYGVLSLILQPTAKSTRSRTRLPLYPADVLPAHGVPGREVLLHALRYAAFIAARQRAAGFRDAAFEAVFVYFLVVDRLALLREWMRGWVAYLDELPGIGYGGFLS